MPAYSLSHLAESGVSPAKHYLYRHRCHRPLGSCDEIPSINFLADFYSGVQLFLNPMTPVLKGEKGESCSEFRSRSRINIAG